MSNFETNELRPDSSDRPNHHRQPKSSFKIDISKINELLENINISRQHLMIGIGAIVLLIIIITIMSSLGGKPAEDGVTEPQQITLNGSNINSTDSTINNNLSSSGVIQPQQIQPPEMVDSQQNVLTPPTDNQQPVQSQQQVNINESVTNSVLPQNNSNATKPANTKPAVTTKPAETTKPTKSSKAGSLANLPSGQVTLQLSGATKPDSLEAFAKKNNLSNYWVYETRRDGKPWFVLVHGTYANAQEANKAVATLPADVQAKKPWVKPIKQVQQESKQR